MNYGLSGERIRLNHQSSNERMSNYSGNLGSPDRGSVDNKEKIYGKYDNNGHLIR